MEKQSVVGVSDEMSKTGGFSGVNVGSQKQKKRVGRPKKEKVELSPKEKFVATILRKAGLDELPPLNDLVGRETGVKLPISSVAVFRSKSSNDALATVWNDLPNRLHLEAPVRYSRMMKVAVKILKDGKLFHPIEVGDVRGQTDCISGRHRLAFLALAYGIDAEIPMIVESTTIEDATLAVVSANDTRSSEMTEKADLYFVEAAHGDRNTTNTQDYQAVRNKSGAIGYAIKYVIIKKSLAELDFKLTATKSRKEGGVATMAAVTWFWKAGLDWSSVMKHSDFEEAIVQSVGVLSQLVFEFQKNEEFNPKFHMATKPMNAIGKIFRDYWSLGQVDALLGKIPSVANIIIDIGDDVGNNKPIETYETLRHALVEKID